MQNYQGDVEMKIIYALNMRDNLLSARDLAKSPIKYFIQDQLAEQVGKPEEHFSAYLAIGSNEQSSLVNEMGPRCSFHNLYKLAKSLSLEIFPLLLADIFNQKPAGTAMNEVFSPKQFTLSQHFMDQSKFLNIYGQTHHLALIHDEKIIYQFFEDNETRITQLAALFSQFPQLLPQQVELRLNLVAGEEISLYTKIQGQGKPDFYTIKTLLALLSKVALEADKSLIETSKETALFEKEGGQLSYIAPWLKEKLSKNANYLEQLCMTTTLAELPYLQGIERYSNDFAIKAYAIAGDKCLFNSKFYSLRNQNIPFAEALMEGNSTLVEWLFNQSDIDLRFKKTVLMTASSKKPVALNRTTTSALIQEGCAFLGLSRLQKSLLDLGLEFDWDGISLTDCFNGFNAGRASDMKAPELETPVFPLIYTFKQNEILIVYMLAHHLACSFPNSEIQLNFVSRKESISNAIFDFFEKNSILLPELLSVKLINYNGGQINLSTKVLQGKGKAVPNYADEIKKMVTEMGLLGNKAIFGLALSPENFPNYRQPVPEQELLFLAPEDLNEKKTQTIFSVEKPEKPKGRELIKNLFSEESCIFNPSQSDELALSETDKLNLYLNSFSFFNEYELAVHSEKNEEASSEHDEDSLRYI